MLVLGLWATLHVLHVRSGLAGCMAARLRAAWLPLALLAGLCALPLGQLWFDGATADAARTREYLLRTMLYSAAFLLTLCLATTSRRVLGLLGAVVVNLLVSLFTGAPIAVLSFVISLIAVPLFAGITAWETNMLKDQYHHLAHDEVTRSSTAVCARPQATCAAGAQPTGRGAQRKAAEESSPRASAEWPSWPWAPSPSATSPSCRGSCSCSR
jgi:FtsH-binding integral membrane protein